MLKKMLLILMMPAIMLGADRKTDARSITEQWARVIVESKYEDLSPDVVERVKLSLLDSIAVMLFTSSLEDSKIYLERQFEIGGRPEAAVWGIGKRLPLETAAAANAFLVHGHEIDDSDLRSGIKISCVTAAPALAVADYLHASGKNLILAAAIAYTVTGRLAAVTPSAQWMGLMPSGIWGPGGAAAASSKLLGMDEDRTVSALGLAIGGGQGSFQYFYDQTEDKKIIVARAARIGVESALLAGRGIVGARHILEGPAGVYRGLMKGYWDVHELRGQIGEGLRDLISTKNVRIANALIDFEPNFDILTHDFDKLDGPMYVYPKFQACSASIGPFLDALDPDYEKARIEVADIDHVVVGRDWPLDSSMARKVIHFQPPKTVMGAQMNLNFIISLYLHKGSASPHDLTAEVLGDPSILDLARRVRIDQVRVGEKYFIKIVRRDGHDLTVPFVPSRGEQYEPLLYALRMKKYRTLTRTILDDAGRDKLKDLVDHLDEVEDVSEWTDHIHALLKQK